MFGRITLFPSILDSLRPFSDFRFYPVYFTGDKETFVRTGNSKIVALVAKFSIMPICLIGGSPSSIVYSRRRVYTSIKSCRVSNLRIQFSSNGIGSNGSGKWIVGFQPDHHLINDPNVIDTELQISKMLLYDSSTVDKAITINYVSQDYDWFHRFVPLNYEIGLIVARFDFNLSDKTEFVSEDFSCSVLVSGNVEVGSHYETLGRYYSAFVVDKYN